MKILLLSDTHGEIDKALRICKKLTGIDMIFHCGDYLSDAYELEDLLGIPAVSVKGNCDSAGPVRRTVETPAGKILLTHGHEECVTFNPNRLLYLAEEEGCIAACFGHTHCAYCEDFSGIRLINPGSLSSPRDGSSGTCAVIRSTEDDFHVHILSYEDFADDPASSGDDGKNKKDKKISKNDKARSGDPNNEKAENGKKKSASAVRGGYLRKLLNYSDRF